MEKKTAYEQAVEETERDLQRRLDRKGKRLGSIDVEKAAELFKRFIDEADSDMLADLMERATGAHIDVNDAGVGSGVEFEVFNTPDYMGFFKGHLTK